MATAKKTTTKRKRSVTAKKLCSRVIKREGIKADGTLMKGFKWAKGGGRAIKVKAKPAAKKRGLGKATCIKMNPDRSTTEYSADNSGNCRYGGVRQRVATAGMTGAKKKAAPKKKAVRKHEGINQKTNRLKPGWKYEKGGKIVRTKK